MFVITKNKEILITRGDTMNINFKIKKTDGNYYKFKAGDIIQFVITEKNNYNEVKINIAYTMEQDSDVVEIGLPSSSTKGIGEPMNRPIDYWYEISLIRGEEVQTLLGYDEKGPKIFRLYPEAGPFE